MKKTIPVSLAAALALGGCVIVDAGERGVNGSDAANGSNGYGTIRAAMIEQDTVLVRVSSNGCTSKEMIRPDVRKVGEDAFTLGFKRVRQDYCKAYLPDGVELTWTFEELGLPEGAEVTLLNRISR